MKLIKNCRISHKSIFGAQLEKDVKVKNLSSATTVNVKINCTNKLMTLMTV